MFSFHSECDPVGFCGGMYGGVGWGGVELWRLGLNVRRKVEF